MTNLLRLALRRNDTRGRTAIYSQRCSPVLSQLVLTPDRSPSQGTRFVLCSDLTCMPIFSLFLLSRHVSGLAFCFLGCALQNSCLRRGSFSAVVFFPVY